MNGSVAICWKRNLRICLKRSLFDRSATRFISNKLVPCLYVEGNKRCVPWEIIIELRFYRENLKISSFSKINIWRMKTHLLLAMDDDERAKRQITAGLGRVEMVKSVKKQQQRTCCCCCCCLSHRVARIPEPIRSKSASDTILKIKFVLAVRNFHHGWCNASWSTLIFFFSFSFYVQRSIDLPREKLLILRKPSTILVNYSSIAFHFVQLVNLIFKFACK